MITTSPKSRRHKLIYTRKTVRETLKRKRERKKSALITHTRL